MGSSDERTMGDKFSYIGIDFSEIEKRIMAFDWAEGVKEPPALRSPTDTGERGGTVTGRVRYAPVYQNSEFVMPGKRGGKTWSQMKQLIVKRLSDLILRGYKLPWAQLMKHHPDLHQFIESLSKTEIDELEALGRIEAGNEARRREAKDLGKPGYMHEPIHIEVTRHPDGELLKRTIEQAKTRIMQQMQVPSHLLGEHRDPINNEIKSEGNSIMKSKLEMRNTAAILSDDIVSVECKFSKHATKVYTYKCRRELAESLKKDDVVIVGHSSQPGAVVIVKEIHRECDLPDAANMEYNWIVQKMDTAELKVLHDWDEQAESQLYKMQRKHQQAQLVKSLGLGDEVDNVAFALPAPVAEAEVVDKDEEA